MHRTPISLLAGVAGALAVAGCSALPGSGPTCGEYMSMSSDDQRDAIVEWASDHDDRVDPENPERGASGFAMFQDRLSIQRYCSDAAHQDDHLGDLSPSG